jgi:hypothetical protein
MIEKVYKAHYVLMNIECDGKTLTELNSMFKFSDAVIRNLVIRKSRAIIEPSPLARSKEENQDDQIGETTPASKESVAPNLDKETGQAGDTIVPEIEPGAIQDSESELISESPTQNSEDEVGLVEEEVVLPSDVPEEDGLVEEEVVLPSDVPEEDGVESEKKEEV